MHQDIDQKPVHHTAKYRFHGWFHLALGVAMLMVTGCGAKTNADGSITITESQEEADNKDNDAQIIVDAEKNAISGGPTAAAIKAADTAHKITIIHHSVGG